jgi:hypothetical protein
MRGLAVVAARAGTRITYDYVDSPPPGHLTGGYTLNQYYDGDRLL